MKHLGILGRRRIVLALLPLSLVAYACAAHHEQQPEQTTAGPNVASDARAFVADGAAFVAHNPRSKFQTRITPAETQIVRADGSSFALRTKLASDAAPLLTARGRRVEKSRENVVEWYENRIDGLEQGFTIASRSSSASSLTLDIELAGNAKLAPASRPNTVDVVTDGAAPFHYGKLAAIDATQRPLVASLGIVDATHARITVDDRDAAYPITIDPLVWAQDAKLEELHSTGNDFGGQVVAISNDTIISGLEGRNAFRGAAVVFARTGGTWSEQQLLGDTNVAPFDNYGGGVGIDGDTCIAGSAAGIFIYTRSGGTWSLQQAIPSVAGTLLSGDTLVTNQNTLPHVFVYQRSGTTWTQSQDLTIDNGDAGFSVAYLNALAMTSDTLVTAARGFGSYVSYDLCIFRKTGSTFALEQCFNSGVTDGGATVFGGGVAIDGDTLIAGALVGGNIAYVYHRTGSVWSQQQILTLPRFAPSSAENFGESVVIKGDVAFVGDGQQDIGSGAIYRYSRSGPTWTYEEEIQPADISSSSFFGASMSMTADTLVIGSPQQGARRGATYVYTYADSNGDACTTATQCHSGFCVDGVCCDTACGGGSPNDCLACNVAAQPGKCMSAPPSVTCRPSVGDCDVAETCDGTNETCPADSVLANGTSCNGGSCVAGACKAEDGGAAGDAGLGANAPPAASDSGCDIGRPGASGRNTMACIGGLAFLGLLLARRKSRLSVMLAPGALLALTIAACSTESPAPPTSDPSGNLDVSHAAFSASYARGLSAAFDANGVSVAASKNSEQTRLRVSEIGRTSARKPLPAREPSRRGARVSYAAEKSVEWYETNARGVEQGMNLEERPSGDGDLVLRVAVSGALSPKLAASGDHVDLVDAANEAIFAYGELHAHDAIGRALTASLNVVDGRIEIAIDDSVASYPVTIDPLVWRQHQELTASDATRSSDFGVAIAMSGNTAVVGARGYDGDSDAAASQNEGAAYVYVRTGNVWAQQAKLVASDASVGASFGRAVAIENDTIVVGAGSTNANTGAVYVFTRSGTTWTQSQRLSGSNSVSGDVFGHAVAIQNGTILVGAFQRNALRGAVYVFTYVGSTWVQQTEIDGTSISGQGEEFGTSVALDSGTMVVGAIDNITGNLGAAYIYVGSGSSWSQQFSALPQDKDSQFGNSVAIEGDTAAVGSCLSFSDPRNGGAVYVYNRVGTTWTLTQILRADDAGDDDQLGTWVALHGNQIMTGAVGANGGAGALYLFQLTSGNWLEATKFVASDPGPDDQFGFGVDFGNNMAIVGAFGHARNTGAAYAFFLGSEGGPCENGDPCATGYCVDGVCCDSPCGGGKTDDCAACSVAAGAAVDGVCGPTTPHLCRAAAGDCDVPESCDGTQVVCPADVVAQNGLTCATGTCSGGKCLPVITSSSSPNDGGSPGNSAAPSSDSGCGCRVGSTSPSTNGAFGLGIFLALAALRRAKKCVAQGKS